MTMVPVSMVRTFHHRDFTAAELAQARGGTTVSVCLPARNEAATIGDIVATVDTELRQRVPLVDEIIVIDDHSSDDTAVQAEAAGAEVVPADAVLVDFATGPGKGEALWKSLAVSSGDLVVWCDADVRSFSPGFVVGMVGALIGEPDLQLVKGFYERPLQDGEGGGRVTELVARPLISMLFPELAPIVQPLAGEYAGRRTALEQLPFVGGYGVDLALMIDTVATFGPDALAQVDLGTRTHRNRTLGELGPQALAILHTALRRADPTLVADHASLVRPTGDPVDLDFVEYPPLASVPGHLRRSA
jgi:glucosyl-3-phosphoglycerate synthase